MRDIQFEPAPSGSIRPELTQPLLPAFGPSPIERMPLSARLERRVLLPTSSHFLSRKHPSKIYPANQVIRSSRSARLRGGLMYVQKYDGGQITLITVQISAPVLKVAGFFRSTSSL